MAGWLGIVIIIIITPTAATVIAIVYKALSQCQAEW